MTLDAAVLGGGPAGVAAAISLGQVMPDAAIAIFDSSARDHWHPGETLSPGAIPLLQSLGCRSAFETCNFLESFGTRAAWGSPEPHENEFLFGLRGNGWRLDRARFDAMLLDCAGAAGIEIRRNFALTGSTAAHSGWRLQFGGSEEIGARFVIDATGRVAAFAAQRGARRMPADRLAGIFVLFESEDSSDTLIEAAETGWWYATTVPGSTAVVAFMSDTDLIRNSRMHRADRWNEALAASHLTHRLLANATPKTLPAIFTAHSQHLSPMGGPGWIAAGDAAMAFDPLSSQGILKALRSGKLASFVAADFLLKGSESHERYERLALAGYDTYNKVKREYYGMEQRWPEAAFWARRR